MDVMKREMASMKKDLDNIGFTLLALGESLGKETLTKLIKQGISRLREKGELD